MRMNYFKKVKIYYCLILFICLIGCKNKSQSVERETVKSTIDQVVTRLYQSLGSNELDTISQPFILSFLSSKEKEVLSKEFWTFEANVPVTVSLMRHVDQKILPFWLAESGFVKTDLLVKNESYTYEVWQKDFNAGRVELGINGFDKHRPVYFISVAAQKKSDSLEIKDVYPSEYALSTFKAGAFTYHDWDSLILTEIPDQLQGQVLFTTVRGRAREAHLIEGFRKTPTPSSETPDQIMLTWSADPKSTIDIQWRNALSTKNGTVKYWIQEAKDTLYADAKVFMMEDRLLQNDRYVNRFTSHLKNLKSGTSYGYQVGSKMGSWSASSEFKTASQEKEPFSFIWFGDTHKSPIWGDMAQKTLLRHPDISFYSIVGDLVSTGLNRDDWDELWQHSGQVFSKKPLMPIPGNHDSQDGLGAWMYKEMFSLPENGPQNQPSEMTYSFTHQDALFLMIDATLPVPNQTAWVENALKATDKKWKFVMFHFPPYNFVEPYEEIMQEWGTLFDRYHVDMVMSGHMHYYLRTKPMFNKQPVSDPSKGTIYTMSISIPGKQEEWLDEPYALKRYQDGPLYQHISIQNNTLKYVCYDPEGNVKDELIIQK